MPHDPAQFDPSIAGSSGPCRLQIEASVQKYPLAKAFSGRWAGAHSNLTCENRSIRFDAKEIVQIRDGVTIPVFPILRAELHGDVAELTLKIGDAAAAMVFSGTRLGEEAEAFRLHVTLVNHRDRISVSDAQTDQVRLGRRVATRSERRTIEKIFAVRKCPA